VKTDHLARFGAREIPRDEFLERHAAFKSDAARPLRAAEQILDGQHFVEQALQRRQRSQRRRIASGGIDDVFDAGVCNRPRRSRRRV